MAVPRVTASAERALIGAAPITLSKLHPTSGSRRSLPGNLSANAKKLRMDAVKIGPTEVRGILEHIDPVGHEADSCDRIPGETERKVCLPAPLNVGTRPKRLQEQEAAVVEIDFADPCFKLPRPPSARADRIEDFNLAETRRRIEVLGIGFVSFGPRFHCQIPVA